VQPLATEWGRKPHHRSVELQQGIFLRQRFCPSFVHRARAQLKKGEKRRAPSDWPDLPAPSVPLIIIYRSSSPASAAPASSPSAASSHGGAS